MDHPLYLFNPDHDLALANNDKNFNPPLSARTFAKDLACLPMWYASSGSVIAVMSLNEEWVEKMQRQFPPLRDIAIKIQSDFSTITSINPWGWNSAVCKRLAVQGFGSALLPETSRLSEIRRLSHRRTAISALQFLREETSLVGLLPLPAHELFSEKEVAAFANCYPKVVFKAPWSGSGKGLCWSIDTMTESRLGWCRNIIEKQGSVVGEVIYDKVQDFAIEFSCQNGKVNFAGYSWFDTERGIYRNNTLISDEAILSRLTDKWITPQHLLTIQHQLLLFIEHEIAPFYTGLLGVDMFVFQQNGEFLLHPCVEINLRMTMGCVARIFHDRFVHPSATGRFYIDHYPSAGNLWQDHLQRQATLPLEVIDGRITQGYLSLSPVTPLSHYRARVEIG
jgi:hypothetical protein